MLASLMRRLFGSNGLRCKMFSRMLGMYLALACHSQAMRVPSTPVYDGIGLEKSSPAWTCQGAQHLGHMF